MTNRERWEEILAMLPDDVFGAVLDSSIMQNTFHTYICAWCKRCGFRCSDDVECPPITQYLNSEVSSWQERQQ